MLRRSLFSSYIRGSSFIVGLELHWSTATWANRYFSTRSRCHYQIRDGKKDNEHKYATLRRNDRENARGDEQNTTSSISARFQHRRFTPKRARATPTAGDGSETPLISPDFPQPISASLQSCSRTADSFCSSTEGGPEAPEENASDKVTSMLPREYVATGRHVSSRAGDVEEFRLTSGLPLPPGSPLPRSTARRITNKVVNSENINSSEGEEKESISKREVHHVKTKEGVLNPNGSQTGTAYENEINDELVAPRRYTEVSTAAICSYLLTLQRVYRMSSRHLMTQRASTEAALTYLRDRLPSQLEFPSHRTPREVNLPLQGGTHVRKTESGEQLEESYSGKKDFVSPAVSYSEQNSKVVWNAKIAVSVIRTASVFGFPLATLPVVETAADTLLNELLNESEKEPVLSPGKSAWSSVGTPLDVAQLTLLVHRLVQREQMNRRIAREVFMDGDEERGAEGILTPTSTTTTTAVGSSVSFQTSPSKSAISHQHSNGWLKWHDQFDEDVGSKERSLLLFYSSKESPCGAEAKLHRLYLQVLLPQLMTQLRDLLSAGTTPRGLRVHPPLHDAAHTSSSGVTSKDSCGMQEEVNVDTEGGEMEHDRVFNREEVEVFSTTLSVLQKALAAHLVVSPRRELHRTAGSVIVFSDGTVTSPTVQKIPFRLFVRGMRCCRRAVDHLFTSALHRTPLDDTVQAIPSSPTAGPQPVSRRGTRFTSRRTSTASAAGPAETSEMEQNTLPTDKVLFQEQVMREEVPTVPRESLITKTSLVASEGGKVSGGTGKTGAQNVNTDILHPILLFSTNTSALDLLFSHRDVAIHAHEEEVIQGTLKCSSSSIAAQWSALREDVLVLLQWGFECIPLARTKHLSAFASSYSRLIQPVMTILMEDNGAVDSMEAGIKRPTTAETSSPPPRRFPLASSRFAIEVANMLVYGTADGTECLAGARPVASYNRCTPHGVVMALCDRARLVTAFFSSTDTAAFLKALSSIMQCCRLVHNRSVRDALTTHKKISDGHGSQTNRERNSSLERNLRKGGELEVLVTTTAHEIVKQLDSDGYSPLRVPSLIFVMRQGRSAPRPTTRALFVEQKEGKPQNTSVQPNLTGESVDSAEESYTYLDAISKRISRYVAKKAGHSSLYTQVVLTVDEYLAIHKALTQLCPVLPDVWLRLVGRLLYDYYFRLSEPEKARMMLATLYDYPLHALHFTHREGTSLTLELAIEHYMCFMTFSGRSNMFFPPHWAIETVKKKTSTQALLQDRPFVEQMEANPREKQQPDHNLPISQLDVKEGTPTNSISPSHLSTLRSIVQIALENILNGGDPVSSSSDVPNTLLDYFLEQHTMRHHEDAVLLKWMIEERERERAGMSVVQHSHQETCSSSHASVSSVTTGNDNTERSHIKEITTRSFKAVQSLEEESRLHPTQRVYHVLALLLRSVRFVPGNHAESSAQGVSQLTSRSELMEEGRILDACGVFFELLAADLMFVEGCDLSDEMIRHHSNSSSENSRETFLHQQLDDIVKVHKTAVVALCILSRWALLQRLLRLQQKKSSNNALHGHNRQKKNEAQENCPLQHLISFLRSHSISFRLEKESEKYTSELKWRKFHLEEDDESRVLLRQQYLYYQFLLGLLKRLSHCTDDQPMVKTSRSFASKHEGIMSQPEGALLCNPHTILSLGNLFYQTTCLEDEFFERSVGRKEKNGKSREIYAGVGAKNGEQSSDERIPFSLNLIADYCLSSRKFDALVQVTLSSLADEVSTALFYSNAEHTTTGNGKKLNMSTHPHYMALGGSEMTRFFSVPTTFALHAVDVQKRVTRMCRVPRWLLQRLYDAGPSDKLDLSGESSLLSRWSYLPIIVTLHENEDVKKGVACGSGCDASPSFSKSRTSDEEKPLNHTAPSTPDAFSLEDNLFYGDVGNCSEEEEEQRSFVAPAPFCTLPPALESLGLLNVLLKQWVTAWVVCPPSLRRRTAVLLSLVACLTGGCKRIPDVRDTEIERINEDISWGRCHEIVSPSYTMPPVVAAFLHCLRDNVYSEEDVVAYFGVLLECLSLVRQDLEELEDIVRREEDGDNTALDDEFPMKDSSKCLRCYQHVVTDLEEAVRRSLEGLQEFQTSQYGPGSSFCDGQSIFSSSSLKSVAFLVAGVARLPPPSSTFSGPTSRRRLSHHGCSVTLLMDVIVEPYLRATADAVVEIARRQQEQRYDAAATLALGAGTSGKRVLVGLPPVELLQYLAMLKPSLLTLVLNTQSHGNQRRFRRTMRGRGAPDSDTATSVMLTPLDCLLHVLLTLDGKSDRSTATDAETEIEPKHVEDTNERHASLSFVSNALEHDSRSLVGGVASTEAGGRGLGGEGQENHSLHGNAAVALLGSGTLRHLGQSVAQGVKRQQQRQQNAESDTEGFSNFWCAASTFPPFVRGTAEARRPASSAGAVLSSSRLRVTDEQEEMSSFLKGAEDFSGESSGMVPDNIKRTQETDHSQGLGASLSSNAKADRWWSPQRQRGRLVASITQLLQESQELSRVTPLTVGRLSLVLDSPRVVDLNKNLKYRITQLLFHTFLKRGTALMGSAVSIPVNQISFMPSSFQRVLYTSPVDVLSSREEAFADMISPRVGNGEKRRSNALVALPESMVRVFPYISLLTWRELLCGPRPLSLFWFSISRAVSPPTKGRRGLGPGGLGPKLASSALSQKKRSTTNTTSATRNHNNDYNTRVPPESVSAPSSCSVPPPGYHARPPRYPMDSTVVRNLKFHHSGFMFLAFLTPSQLFALRESLGPLSFLQLGKDFLQYYVNTWIGVECRSAAAHAVEDIALTDPLRMAERANLYYLINSWGVEAGGSTITPHQSETEEEEKVLPSRPQQEVGHENQQAKCRTATLNSPNRTPENERSSDAPHGSCRTDAIHRISRLEEHRDVSPRPAFLFSRHPHRAAPLWMVYHRVSSKEKELVSSSGSVEVDKTTTSIRSHPYHYHCRGVDLWYAVVMEMLCSLVMVTTLGSPSSNLRWRTAEERSDALLQLAREERQATELFGDRRRQLLVPVHLTAAAEPLSDHCSPRWPQLKQKERGNEKVMKADFSKTNCRDDNEDPSQPSPRHNNGRSSTVTLDISLLVSLMKLLETVYYDGVEMPSVPITHLQEELHVSSCSSSNISTQRSSSSENVPFETSPDTTTHPRLYNEDGKACSTQFLLSLFQLSLDVAKGIDPKLVAVNACSVLSYWAAADDALRQIILSCGEEGGANRMKVHLEKTTTTLGKGNDNDDDVDADVLWAGGAIERGLLQSSVHQQRLVVEDAVQSSFLHIAAEVSQEREKDPRLTDGLLGGLTSPTQLSGTQRFEVHLRSALEAFHVEDIVVLFSLTARKMKEYRADTTSMETMKNGSLPIAQTAQYTQTLTVLLDVLSSDHLPSMRSRDILLSAFVALTLYRRSQESTLSLSEKRENLVTPEPSAVTSEADHALLNLSLQRELRRYLSAIPILCANDMERFPLSDLVVLWTHLFVPVLPPSPKRQLEACHPTTGSSSSPLSDRGITSTGLPHSGGPAMSLGKLIQEESFVSAEAARSLADHLVIHHGLEDTVMYEQLEQFRLALHAARSVPPSLLDPTHRATLIQFGFFTEERAMRCSEAQEKSKMQREKKRSGEKGVLTTSMADPWTLFWQRLLISLRPTLTEQAFCQHDDVGDNAFWVTGFYEAVDAENENGSVAGDTRTVLMPLTSTLPISSKKSRKTLVADDSRSQFLFFLRFLVFMEVMLTSV